MRGLASGLSRSGFFLCMLMMKTGAAAGQQNAPPPHVVIPNPTPREPDLTQVYGENAHGDKKTGALSVQSQLRAREIWLESNQILLLAQQLQQEVLPGKKHGAMTSSAAKVAKIEKLAQSVQEQMKIQ